MFNIEHEIFLNDKLFNCPHVFVYPMSFKSQLVTTNCLVLIDFCIIFYSLL